MRLIPTEHAWVSEPSPSDVLDEAQRFQRLLVIAGLAAGTTGARDMLSLTTQHVAVALTRWSEQLAPLIEPVAIALEATRYSAGEAFGDGPETGHLH